MEQPTKSFPTPWASNCSGLRADESDSLRSAAACTITTPLSAGRCFALRAETSSRSPPRPRLRSKGGLMEEVDLSRPPLQPVREPGYGTAVVVEFLRTAAKKQGGRTGDRLSSQNQRASRFFLHGDKM